jgi:hypothetical protein
VSHAGPISGALPGAIRFVLADGLLALSGLVHLSWLADLAAGHPFARLLRSPDRSSSTPLGVTVAFVETGIWLATVVLFLIWLHNAYVRPCC